MKKPTKLEWIITILLLVVLQIMCLWSIDISTSAMLTPGAVLTNGWQERDPVFIYHMALYGLIIITVVLAVIGIYFALGEKKDVGNN